MSESTVDTEELSRNSGKSDSNKASTSSKMSGDKPVKRMGKRPGRKPSKIDVKAKLERSRQSARECRARKKLRYQYLEELVMNREKAIYTLREELEMYKQWCIQLDNGIIPGDLIKSVSMSESTGVPQSPQASESLNESSHAGGSSSSSYRPSMTSFPGTGAQSDHHKRASSHLQKDVSGHLLTGAANYPQIGASSHLQTGASSHPAASDSRYFGTEDFSLADAANYYASRYPVTSTSNFSGSGASLFQGMNSPPLPRTNLDYSDIATTLADLTKSLTQVPAVGTSGLMSHAHQQPSTSSGIGMLSLNPVPQWYSFLAELEPHLSRQGAESASGTPKSTDGTSNLPTVIADFLDSSDSSEN